MDVDEIWSLLDDWKLWAVCGIAFGLGALGGTIQAVSSTSSWKQARRDLLRRLLVGAVAAVAVLYVTEPETAMTLIGGSLVAGYAGKAILDALEARTRIAAANARAEENQRNAVVALEARDRALRAAELALEESNGPSRRTARELLRSARSPLMLREAGSADSSSASVAAKTKVDVKVVDFIPPPDQDIEVTATIGNGQLGGWAILLGGAVLATGSEPKAVSLGKRATLAGTVMEVSASMRDVRGEHNRLSLRVNLTGRTEPIDIEHEVPAGGRAAYSVIVNFGA